MGEVKELNPAPGMPAGVVNLGQWAMRLKYDTARALAAPGAIMMIPAPVAELVSELSALVGVLAREVDSLRGANHGKK